MTGHHQIQPVHLGIDIGSTTLKMVALGPDGALLFQRYERHNGSHGAALRSQFELLGGVIDGAPLRIAVTGSQGSSIARQIGAVYIQEVIAQSIAVKKWYPATRTSIELGGQDSKMVFYADHPGRPRRSWKQLPRVTHARPARYQKACMPPPANTGKRRLPSC